MVARTTPEKFWSKVDKRGPEDCWPWLGRLTNMGYGQIGWQGKPTTAHRVAWEIANGEPVPPGLVVDHLCRHKPCCNPSHLEPVTHGENVRRGFVGFDHRSYNHQVRKTRCPQGHEYDEQNTYVTAAGHRQCRACRRQRERERWDRRTVRG